MKLPLLAAFATLATIFGTNAQSYSTGFDNPSQIVGWQTFRKGSIQQMDDWDFQNVQAYTAPNCLAHNYPVGGTTPTDDWMVSPALTLASGGSIDSLRYAFSGFGTPQPGDTVSIYLLHGNADPALATSATVLHQFTGASYMNDNTWRLLAPISLPTQAGNSYIAFRYKTVVNWLDVRFDNLAWTDFPSADIAKNQLVASKIYPNPVTDHSIQVEFDAAKMSGDVTMKLFSLSGQLVHSVKVSSHVAVDLPLAQGLYSYQLHDATGAISNGKVIIAD